MKEHVRLAYLEYGFPLPEEHHFTILCRWRPPKELWPTHGRRWRDIAVEVLGANKPDILADETCLFLIATYCGTALAHHVIGPEKELIPVRFPTEYNRTWFRDVVTFGVDVVHCPDLWAPQHNEDTDPVPTTAPS
ncbi:MAG: hypothetical protein WA937_15490 [Flavobacteriales bacterium]